MPPHQPTPYDHVTYPSNPFKRTWPYYLATVAGLYGMTPAPPSRCRVLELGCGAGGNIVPMAYQSANSQFVGIDLSGSAIDAGRGMVDQLGLSNVSLQHRDIMDLSNDDGGFDYIIAHGVYSWVAQPVRDKMLSVFKNNLNPHGLAYVSYNALPGAQMRELARSIMLFHVRGLTDPQARNAESRRLMKFLADASSQDQIYGFILRDQQHRIEGLADAVFIHDDLDEGSKPFFLYQVVEAAGQYGLQYLTDSDFPILGEHRWSDEVRAALSAIPVTDAARRDQYIDFIEGRSFRTSLFCHQNVTLIRPSTPDRIRSMFLSGALSPDGTAMDPANKDVGVFKAPSGAVLRTNQPLSKAALVVMAQTEPEAIGFDDLVERACDMLGYVEAELDAEEIDALANVLFQAVRTDLIEAYFEPPLLTSSIGERPKASALARWQLSTGAPLATNLLHKSVQCEDDTLRRFIPLVDGTRTASELRVDLEHALRTCAVGSAANISRLTSAEAVHNTLKVMAKLALLEA